MLTDARQRDLYKSEAPELLTALDQKNHCMRREGNHDCAQFHQGSCKIHADYGERFLGDGCYFYPRMIHNIGGELHMVAAPSCPEIMRLMMTANDPFAIERLDDASRPPIPRRDLLPQNMPASTANHLMAQCMEYAKDDTHTPEECLHTYITLTSEWEPQNPPTELPRRNHTYVSAPQAADAHAIFYALVLLDAFGTGTSSKRLPAILSTMAQALDCAFDRPTRNLTLGPNAALSARQLQQRWHAEWRAIFTPLLRRWLQAQLALTSYPFGGLTGLSISERTAVLVQRYTTARLALCCFAQSATATLTPLDILQSLSRFLDHLADGELTRMIHRDCGWQQEERLRGLLDW